MRTWIATLAVAALLCATAFGGEEGKKKKSEIDKLKEILQKMEVVEQLLAKSQLEEGSKTQEEILKDLKEKVKSGKLKKEEVLKEIDKQLQVVVKKMKEIDADIEKIIQNVKLSQGQGSGSGMEMKGNSGKSKKEQQAKRAAEKERDLKKLRDQKEKGAKKNGGKAGEQPADRAYDERGKGPDGAAPRAEGSGRWGDLPLKEFKKALASGDWTLPEKYKAMILKYMEMLAKKAAEEGK
ncbi:MAG: hypothetical protein ACYTHM_23135 [Planctomycetota bacterium]|jgi:hypothetical protein